MIGMDFISFLILLIISVVVSAILHFGLKYHVTPGLASFFGKVVLGWIGAWLGSPVFGYWFGGLNRDDVYYIPAILGSVALILLAVDAVHTFRGSANPEAQSEPARQAQPM